MCYVQCSYYINIYNTDDVITNLGEFTHMITHFR